MNGLRSQRTIAVCITGGRYAVSKLSRTLVKYCKRAFIYIVDGLQADVLFNLLIIYRLIEKVSSVAKLRDESRTFSRTSVLHNIKKV